MGAVPRFLMIRSMVMVMMMIFDERGQIFLSAPAAFEFKDRRKFMRFRELFGGFEKILVAFELEGLPLAIGPHGLQRDDVRGGRRGGLAFRVVKIEPKTRRHIGFENTEFDLAARSGDHGSAVRARGLVLVFVVIVSVFGIVV